MGVRFLLSRCGHVPKWLECHPALFAGNVFVCHEKQVSVRKTQRLKAFSPQFPFFLLGRTGRPLVSVHRDGKAAIGYSNRRLACEAGKLMLQQGVREIGVLSVSTAERFQQVVSQLTRHEVQYLIWDQVGESADRQVFQLEPVPRPN